MDQICISSCPNGNSVAIVHGHGEWFVRVIENGFQRTETYDCKIAAENRAEGDRKRLGLEHVERV